MFIPKIYEGKFLEVRINGEPIEIDGIFGFKVFADRILPPEIIELKVGDKIIGRAIVHRKRPARGA